MTTILNDMLATTAAPPARMSPDDYLLLGYVLGLALLAGYAVNLWLVSRWLSKRERSTD